MKRVRLVSESADITSGVPWGSVFGPLLFLFVNDLPAHVNSTCPLFADDCLLYWQVNTPNDAAILHQDLYNLEQWAEKWFMKFNPAKCVILTVTVTGFEKTRVSEIFYISRNTTFKYSSQSGLLMPHCRDAKFTA